MSEKWIEDPGHGGKDNGASFGGQVEKEWALEAALYVDKRLTEHGIHSDTTRNSDETLDPVPRTDRVKQSGATRCLSHHYNAGGGNGAEFIHSIFAEGKFENMLLDEFKAAGYPTRRVFFRESTRYPGKDWYYMHRLTGSVKTTIIEYDFLDGPNFSKLQDKDYRIGMYECVVRVVCREEGVSYKPLKPPEPKEEIFYRVIAGSFKEKENALEQVDRLKKLNVDSFVHAEKVVK